MHVCLSFHNTHLYTCQHRRLCECHDHNAAITHRQEHKGRTASVPCRGPKYPIALRRSMMRRCPGWVKEVHIHRLWNHNEPACKGTCGLSYGRLLQAPYPSPASSNCDSGAARECAECLDMHTVGLNKKWHDVGQLRSLLVRQHPRARKDLQMELCRHPNLVHGIAAAHVLLRQAVRLKHGAAYCVGLRTLAAAPGRAHAGLEQRLWQRPGTWRQRHYR